MRVRYVPDGGGGATGSRSAWQMPPWAQSDLSTSYSKTSTAWSGQPMEFTTASATLRIKAFFSSRPRPDHISMRTKGMIIPFCLALLDSRRRVLLLSSVPLRSAVADRLRARLDRAGALHALQVDERHDHAQSAQECHAFDCGPDAVALGQRPYYHAADRGRSSEE